MAAIVITYNDVYLLHINTNYMNIMKNNVITDKYCSLDSTLKTTL